MSKRDVEREWARERKKRWVEEVGTKGGRRERNKRKKKEKIDKGEGSSCESFTITL